MYTYETLQFTVCNIKENKKRKCKNFAFYMFREKMRNVRKLRNAKNFAKKICKNFAKNWENFAKKFAKILRKTASEKHLWKFREKIRNKNAKFFENSLIRRHNTVVVRAGHVPTFLIVPFRSLSQRTLSSPRSVTLKKVGVHSRFLTNI